MLGQTEFYSLTHHSKNQPLKFYLSNLLKIVSISGSFPGLKRFGRFAEPLNRTSNLPNLLFYPKNRTSNLPNLKKPNEPPNQTRFVLSLEKILHFRRLVHCWRMYTICMVTRERNLFSPYQTTTTYLLSIVCFQISCKVEFLELSSSVIALYRTTI